MIGSAKTNGFAFDYFRNGRHSSDFVEPVPVWDTIVVEKSEPLSRCIARTMVAVCRGAAAKALNPSYLRKASPDESARCRCLPIVADNYFLSISQPLQAFRERLSPIAGRYNNRNHLLRFTIESVD